MLGVTILMNGGPATVYARVPGVVPGLRYAAGDIAPAALGGARRSRWPDLSLHPSPLHPHPPHPCCPFTVLRPSPWVWVSPAGATSFPCTRFRLTVWRCRFVLGQDGFMDGQGWFDLRQDAFMVGQWWFGLVGMGEPGGKVHCQPQGPGSGRPPLPDSVRTPVPAPALIGQNLLGPGFRPGLPHGPRLRFRTRSGWAGVRSRLVAGCWSVGSRGGS